MAYLVGESVWFQTLWTAIEGALWHRLTVYALSHLVTLMWQLIVIFITLHTEVWWLGPEKWSVYGWRREFKDFRFWIVNNKILSNLWCLGHFEGFQPVSSRPVLSPLGWWDESYWSPSWTRECLVLTPSQAVLYSENLTAVMGLFSRIAWI